MHLCVSGSILKDSSETLSTVPSLLAALNVSDCNYGEGTLYDHTMELLDKSRNVSLSEYKNKVVLLINVASF